MGAFIFGISLPTFIVFYVTKDLGQYRRALLWLLFILCPCCAVSIFIPHSTSMLTAQQKVQGNDILNHISYGHMGLTTAIVGLFVALQIGKVAWHWPIRMVGMISVILGIDVIVASASRGALVSSCAVLPWILFTAGHKGSKISSAFACIILPFIVVFAVASVSSRGVDLVHRVGSFEAYTSADPSVSSRETSYREAWNQFLDNPLLGSSLVERNTLFYPHNILIEAFMATGIFGGAAFLTMLLVSAYRGLQMTRRNPSLGWIFFCFVQCLVASMFSGGIYMNGALWGLLGIMLGAEMPASRYQRVLLPAAAFQPQREQ